MKYKTDCSWIKALPDRFDKEDVKAEYLAWEEKDPPEWSFCNVPTAMNETRLRDMELRNKVVCAICRYRLMRTLLEWPNGCCSGHGYQSRKARI